MSMPERTHAGGLETYRDARVLVLGASGFIGRWVMRGLQEAGARAVAGARNPEACRAVLRSVGVDSVALPFDALEEGQVRTVLDEVQPDAVVNLVAYGVQPGDTDEALAERINADFPAVLASAVAARTPEAPGAVANRLIHVGSQYEYGPRTEMAEEDPCTPTTLYGRTKLEGTERVQEVCADTGLTALTVRLFNVFGPGEGEHRLLPSLMRAAHTGEPIQLTSGRQIRDFTYVEDVAEGLLRLGAAFPLDGDVVNLASGRPIALRELVSTVAHELRIPSQNLEFGARPDRAAEAAIVAASIERLRHLTGWTPPTQVATAIRRTVAFAQQSVETS